MSEMAVNTQTFQEALGQQSDKNNENTAQQPPESSASLPNSPSCIIDQILLWVVALKPTLAFQQAIVAFNFGKQSVVDDSLHYCAHCIQYGRYHGQFSFLYRAGDIPPFRHVSKVVAKRLGLVFTVSFKAFFLQIFPVVYSRLLEVLRTF